jgi:hypothetical protein
MNRHASLEQATQSIRKFAADMRGTAQQPDAGEEQYSLPDNGNTIYFRKRHFTVRISATSTDEKDEKKLIKQFARYIGVAIKDN